MRDLILIKNARATITVLIGLVVLLLAPGCATPPRQPAVPEKLQNQAQIPGLENIRYRIGNPDDLAEMAREGMESVQREQAFLAASGHQGPLPARRLSCHLRRRRQRRVRRRATERLDGRRHPADLQTGDRRQHRGPDRAVRLCGAGLRRRAEGGVHHDFRQGHRGTRSMLSALTGDAMADNAPLSKLIAKYVDQALLDTPCSSPSCSPVRRRSRPATRTCAAARAARSATRT